MKGIVAAIAITLAAPMPASASSVRASYYSGHRCADGTLMNALSVAHRTLPFNTELELCFHGCARGVVHDRGPFIRGRDVDVSTAIARRIGLVASGVANIEMRIISAGRAIRHHRNRRRHRRQATLST